MCSPEMENTFLPDKLFLLCLSCDMKDKIRTDFKTRYKSTLLNTVLDTATILDPRFKNTFVTMEEEVKATLLQKHDEPQVS